MLFKTLCSLLIPFKQIVDLIVIRMVHLVELATKKVDSVNAKKDGLVADVTKVRCILQ